MLPNCTNFAETAPEGVFASGTGIQDVCVFNLTNNLGNVSMEELVNSTNCSNDLRLFACNGLVNYANEVSLSTKAF